MRRREFITLLGGAAVAPTMLWTGAAHAQQDGRVRRIGMMLNGAESDPARRAELAALRDGLARLGWTEGRNLRVDLRWVDDPTRLVVVATELVGLAPDVIVTSGGAATRAVKERTQTIPIVFTAAGDAVANGLLRNIAQPEGNVTGFSSSEPSVAGKKLGLLKEAAPRLARVAILFVPELAATGPSYIASIEAVAPGLGVQTVNVPVRNSVDIVRALDAFAAEPNGGIVVLPPPPVAAIRDTIIQLAAQHRLPVIYPNRTETAAGGLMSYATAPTDQYRRAATYVDRLLRGAKVSELPVQFPTKYELIVNVKAAKAIGLTIPEAFLLRADELIE